MDPQQLNSYSYARNNPIGFKDPNGEYIESLIDVGFIVYDVFDLAIAYAGGDDYSEQLGYLSLDATGLALPFATGLGLAARGAAKTAKMVKVGVSAVDDVNDISKVSLKGAEIQEKLLPKVQNTKVKNLISDVFRKEDKEAGGLVGALRKQARTGQYTGGKPHVDKGKNTLGRINNLLDDFNKGKESLSKYENNLLNTLKDSVENVLKLFD